MAEFSRDENKPIFDPRKSYKWEPTDKFILTGIEFDAIYKALRANTSHPDYQRIVSSYEALKVAEQIFIEGVEAGIVKEIETKEEKPGT